MTWTPKEDAILKSLYETGSRDEILSKFPNRTWKHIYRRSIILGLSREKDGAWKKEEDEILKKFYPSEPHDGLMTMLPGRTWKSISWHAINILRLVRDKKATQEENKKTNQARRGTDYPTQSAEVRDKVKETVQAKYGVDNVFQSEVIKEKMTQTNLEKFGVKNPQQNKDIQRKTAETNVDRYGVDNPFQLIDRVQEGMIKKYGKAHPQHVPEIRKRTEDTNIKRYGFPTPSQNPEIKEKLIQKLNTDEVREKKYNTRKERGTFSESEEENELFEYMKSFYPDIEQHKLHPTIKYVFDYYFPTQDLWGQFDGGYWHNQQANYSEGPQKENIRKTALRDELQNRMIPNLVRFSEDDFKEAKKDGTLEIFVKETLSDKLEQLKNQPQTCHQYKKKIQHYSEDINQLPFNPENLKASDFALSAEEISDEIVSFIKKYEWLGDIGVSPKWCFTARYKGFLGGAVLINEPTTPSKIIGEETHRYEALIQRGASASWTPKNLGSRLIMFSCKWMVNNTNKRVFVGYADTSANEKGIIYRACNFDYLGNNFGVSKLLRHPSIPRIFDAHSLKRTSAFIRWCRNNNIVMERDWFNEKGFKNIETIPPEIKRAWYDWCSKIVSESEPIKIDKKMKYALILGKDKRETRNLRDLRQYEYKPYPTDTKNSSIISPVKVNPAKNWNRKNNAKDQFLIDNYGKMTKPEMAQAIGETPRWVKRSLARLAKQSKITRMNPSKSEEELLSEEKWLPEIKNRAISLRIDFLKYQDEICETLKNEFEFVISVGALNFWFKKFNCPFPTKEDWLKRFLPIETIKSFLEKGYRRIDIVNYLKDRYGVYISDDIVSLYIRSFPIFADQPK